MNRFFAYFSGFPTHHFPDEIAERLKKEIPVRKSLVFVSAWPAEYSRNDGDATGMHEMFAEQGMGFDHYSVIDDRTESKLTLKLISEASCIFLMGGNATAQMRLLCDKGIRDAVISSSAATLGVSAGAMNMGKTTVDIWESLIPYEGLGFADITMIGHFSYDNEERLDLMKQVSTNYPVCAMADESAIFIQDTQVTCTGEIHWIEKGEIKPFAPDLVQSVCKGTFRMSGTEKHMTKENRTDIARRGDWKTEPMPQQTETFVLDRSFSAEEMEALRRGNIPQAMEDKWFWYMEGSTLWAHRSWTGHCIYRIDFSEDNNHLVTVNRDPQQYGCTSIEEDREVLNRLLDWWTHTPYDHYNEWLSETVEMLKR